MIGNDNPDYLLVTPHPEYDIQSDGRTLMCGQSQEGDGRWVYFPDDSYVMLDGLTFAAVRRRIVHNLSTEDHRKHLLDRGLL